MADMTAKECLVEIEALEQHPVQFVTPIIATIECYMQAAAARAREEEREACAVKIATFFDWCKPIGEHANMAVAQQFAEEGAAALRARTEGGGE